MQGMHDGKVGEGYMTRKDVLGRVRMQVKLVRRLSEQIREYAADGLRSLRLDGAAKGTGGVYRGLDVRIEKKEALERMLRTESRLLRNYEKEARREMDAMKPEHYTFSAMYYIAGLSMEETAETMDRSLRQCARYKREIEEA